MKVTLKRTLAWKMAIETMCSIKFELKHFMMLGLCVVCFMHLILLLFSVHNVCIYCLLQEKC